MPNFKRFKKVFICSLIMHSSAYGIVLVEMVCLCASCYPSTMRHHLSWNSHHAVVCVDTPRFGQACDALLCTLPVVVL